jgi:hypothetical protein
LRAVVAEEAEERTLGAWLGPGSEGTAVTGGGENSCAIDGDAVFSVLDGAGESNDKVGDG